MNLVKQIMDQLSGNTFSQLGSLLGADAETTERTATAAVPSILSALSGVAATDDGAKKLSNILGGLDTSGLGNIAQMLGGNAASSFLSNGTSLLGSVFGDSVTTGLASTLSRFTGMNSSLVKTLLGYLMPLVLGKVAGQWKNQGGTSSALKSLFADQRDNIANAIPAGFSLADIPGWGDAKQTVHNAARHVEREYGEREYEGREPVAAAASPMSWLLPLALALLGGFLLWQFLRAPREVATRVDEGPREVAVRKPELPAVQAPVVEVPRVELTSVRDDLTGLFKTFDTTFTDIRDAASAERAMPALRELDEKIDAMNQILSRLPAESRATLRPVLEEQIGLAKEKAEAANSIEGIGADFKSLIRQIITKITNWITNN